MQFTVGSVARIASCLRRAEPTKENQQQILRITNKNQTPLDELMATRDGWATNEVIGKDPSKFREWKKTG